MVWLKALWDWIPYPIRFYIEYFKEKKVEVDRIIIIKQLQTIDPFIYK